MVMMRVRVKTKVMVMLRVRLRARVRVRPQNWIFQIHNIQGEMLNPIMVHGGCTFLQDKVEVWSCSMGI